MKNGVYILMVITALFTWLDYTRKQKQEQLEQDIANTALTNTLAKRDTSAISAKVPTALPVTTKAKTKKPVRKIASVVKTSDEFYEDQIHELFKRFIDTENNPVFGWKDFALQVSNLLEKQHKHLALAKKLKELSNSTTVWYIGYQLLSYKNLLPVKTQKLLKQYSRSELLSRMSYRVKQQQA